MPDCRPSLQLSSDTDAIISNPSFLCQQGRGWLYSVEGRHVSVTPCLLKAPLLKGSKCVIPSWLLLKKRVFPPTDHSQQGGRVTRETSNPLKCEQLVESFQSQSCCSFHLLRATLLQLIYNVTDLPPFEARKLYVWGESCLRLESQISLTYGIQQIPPECQWMLEWKGEKLMRFFGCVCSITCSMCDSKTAPTGSCLIIIVHLWFIYTVIVTELLLRDGVKWLKILEDSCRCSSVVNANDVKVGGLLCCHGKLNKNCLGKMHV